MGASVTIGTERHEILQAAGTAGRPWLNYTYRRQRGELISSNSYHVMTWQGRQVALHDIKQRTGFEPNESTDAYWERVALLYREQSRLILEKTVALLS